MNLFNSAEDALESKPDANPAIDLAVWRATRVWKKMGVKVDAARIARQLSHPIFQQPTPLADAALKAVEESLLSPKPEPVPSCRYRCRTCGSESVTTLSWPCRQDGNGCDLAVVGADGFEVWD